MSFVAKAKSICRSPEHLCESAWIGRAGQDAPQASDHCLMSTSSAVGWIRLASLHGCMSHISRSPSGQDPELCAVCLVRLLWGVTLKAALKGAVKMFLKSALLWGRCPAQYRGRLQCCCHNLAASLSLTENLDYPKAFMSTDWPHTAVPAWEPDVNSSWTVCGYLFVILRYGWSLTVLWKLCDYVPNGQCDLCVCIYTQTYTYTPKK